MARYNQRRWLNPEDSHFTGSVVCHDNVVSNQGKPPERYMFLEIASCHGKMKLHADKNSGNEEEQVGAFIQKLNLLENEIHKFKHHLIKSLIVDPEEIK